MIYLVSEPTYKAISKIFNITAEDARYKLTDKKLTLNDIENNIMEFEKMVPNKDIPTKEEFINAYIKNFENNNGEMVLEKTLNEFWPGQYNKLDKCDYISLSLAKVLQNWNPPPRLKTVEVDKGYWDYLKNVNKIFGFKDYHQIKKCLFGLKDLGDNISMIHALMFAYHELKHPIGNVYADCIDG